MYSLYDICDGMPSGSRKAAESGSEISNGPSSMVNTEGEGQHGGTGVEEQEQPTMLGSSSSNNIDPAILKAMDPHNGGNLWFFLLQK